MPRVPELDGMHMRIQWCHLAHLVDDAGWVGRRQFRCILVTCAPQVSKLWAEAASSPRVDAAVWAPAVQAILEMQPEEVSQSDSEVDSEVDCGSQSPMHEFDNVPSVVEIGPHQRAFRAAIRGVLER